jgi:hypothetical protein
MKLLRHYNTVPFVPESDFVKPPIAKSARVRKLLKSFPIDTPKQATATTSNERARDLSAALFSNRNLQENFGITNSRIGRAQAWLSYSGQDPEMEEDDDREYMMVSGLSETDLAKEERFEENYLPDWRKIHTGEFARLSGNRRKSQHT